MHMQDDFLETETGRGIYEVQMGIRRVKDDKPFHLGISILQHSKAWLTKKQILKHLVYLIVNRFSSFFSNFLNS